MPTSDSIRDVPATSLPDPLQFGADWLVEAVGMAEVHAHRIQKVVAEISLASAQVAVLQTGYGRVLVKNNRLQSTEKDEWIYHEALVHPAMVAHPNPRSVLCIGGTTGAITREVLRHKTVEQVLVFWVDRNILDALDHHLPYAERALMSDPRVKGLYGSPLDETVLGEQKFDVIIADPPEPSESGAPDKDVYRHVVESSAKILAANGILAIAGGAVHPVTESLSTLPEALAIARRNFPAIKLAIAPVPSLGIPWGMLFCSRSLDSQSLDSAAVDERLLRRGLGNLRFYDGETHAGIFSAPKHVRSWLASGTSAAFQR